DAAKLSVDALSPDFENTHVVLTGNDRFEMEEMFRVFSEILGRQIEVKYIDAGKNGGHYSISPYAFTPKVGKKITSPIYTDMGQGIIQVMEEIHHKITDK